MDFFVELKLLLKLRCLSVARDCLKRLFQMVALLLSLLNSFTDYLTLDFLNKEMNDKERRNGGVYE